MGRIPAPSWPDLRGPLLPLKPFLEWLYKRMPPALVTLTELGATVLGLGTDLTALDAVVDTLAAIVVVLDGRIDALEAAPAPTFTQHFVWHCASPQQGAAGTYYYPFGQTTANVAATSEITAVQVAWGMAGTLRNLRGKFHTVVADADTAVCTLRINGVDTALTITLTGNSTALVSDTTHSVAVSVGDLITLKDVQSGAILSVSGFSIMWDFEA